MSLEQCILGGIVLQPKYLTKEYALLVYEDFLELYKPYEIIRYKISDTEEVVVIEDALLFYVKIDMACEFILYEENREEYINQGICGLDIEELTPNKLIQYKHSRFEDYVSEKYGIFTYSIRYARFHGTNIKYLPNSMLSHAEYLMQELPEVRLQERYEAWEGELYNIVVFEMTGIEGTIAYAVDVIKGKVHPYVLKIAKNLIERKPYIYAFGEIGLSQYGAIDEKFTELFRSHKNVRIIKRLQENMRYFSLEPRYFKEESKVYQISKEVLHDVKSGKYDYIERIEYRKPENRWKSEELVYKIILKIYKQNGVIYQHRPHFLRSSLGHQLSYDVYISEKKIAVEYQGKQHFEPVEYFGGKEAYERQKQRDEEKAALSKMNGIKLVYINYWEEITPELIRMKIEDAEICTNS